MADAPIPFLDLAPAARAEGVIALPGSKSISNRTLLLAALSTGTTTIRGLLDADDVDRMLDALAALGIAVERNAKNASSRDKGDAFPSRKPRSTSATRAPHFAR